MLEFKDILLEEGEFYNEVTTKRTIVLHHTAGGHNPANSVAGWEKDKNKEGGQLKVATSYLVGGLSTRDRRDNQWDGVIIKTFDDTKWAHHIGSRYAINTQLNKESIGIEICNYGGLTKTKDFKFLTYVNSEVPADMVYELDTPFRGYKYFHKYTEKQIEATRLLILDIAHRHPTIDIKKGLQLNFRLGLDAMGKAQDQLELINSDVLVKGGIYAHTNYITGKWDIHPQPEMVRMIMSL